MKTTINLLLAVMVLTGISCRDDKESEMLNSTYALQLVGTWAPQGFYTEFGTSNPTLRPVCEATAYYTQETYREALSWTSQSISLGGRQEATLTPSCETSPSTKYTWNVYAVPREGNQLVLQQGEVTRKFRIHAVVMSGAGDYAEMILVPIGTAASGTFAMSYLLQI